MRACCCSFCRRSWACSGRGWIHDVDRLTSQLRGAWEMTVFEQHGTFVFVFIRFVLQSVVQRRFVACRLGSQRAPSMRYTCCKRNGTHMKHTAPRQAQHPRNSSRDGEQNSSQGLRNEWCIFRLIKSQLQVEGYGSRLFISSSLALGLVAIHAALQAGIWLTHI